MDKISLGCDMSKPNFQAEIGLAGKEVKLGKFENTLDGFNKLNQSVSQHKTDDTVVHLIVEPTGTYHLSLIAYAYEQGWQVSLPNPKTIRDWAKGQGTRNKSDKVDARILARYGMQENPSLEQPLPLEVDTLSQLLSRIDDLEHMIRQEKNRLEAEQQRPSVCKVTLDDLKASIRTLERRRDKIQRAIDKHVKAHDELKQHRNRLLKVPGIGKKSVLPILVFLYRWNAHTCGTGDAKGLAAFAGLDPVEHSSGTSVFKRPRISKMGDSNIRAKLFMCALGGISSKDSPLVSFYKGLVGRNKSKKVALVAASRKILTWAFGVFRSGKPFDPTLASPKPPRHASPA